MGAEDNGLTLEGLAQRLEALERENERMRSENAELRSNVATLEGTHTRQEDVVALRDSDRHRDREPLSQFEGQVSRRSLLSKAGAAAVAAVAAGTLLNPREARADHSSFFHTLYATKILAGGGDNLGTVSATNDHGAEALRGWTSSASKAAVYGENQDSGPAVEGIAQGSNGRGVNGTGRYGVWGESNRAGFYGVTGRNINTDGTGVRGVADSTNGRAGVRGEGSTGVWGSSSRTGYSGVYGQHTGSSGFGVVGDGKGSGAGVLGRNSGGEGLRGEGSTQAEVAGVRGLGKTGVWGSSATTGYSGVYGQHTGSSGYGIVGDGKGETGAGVLGRNGFGYGGQFEGGKAQLKLNPGGSAGKPTSGAHTKGEVYMDSAGTLFVCTADGTPGTWRRFQTAAV